MMTDEQRLNILNEYKKYRDEYIRVYAEANMLAGYTAKRAELKAQHQSTREVAKHIRNCKKYIEADQEKFAEIQF